jgi:hypothetical protein
VVCTGGQTLNYSPPLGPLPQNHAVNLGKELTCLGGPFLTGTTQASFTASVSCLIPPPMGTISAAHTLTYSWSNGQTSTVSFSTAVVVRAASQTIVTSVGTITSGYSLGSVVQREVVSLDLDVLSCLASNVDHQYGSETFTIVL